MTAQKTALVTGGASGIGEAAARRFAAAGWQVVIADINDARGESIATELGALYRHLNVTDAAETAALVAEICTRFGGIDALVTAGGVLQSPLRLMEMDLTELDRIFDINVKGTILTARIVGQRMAAAGQGAIVTLGSLNSFVPMPHPAYAISKVAITRVTELLACELGPQGVRVNAVAPGYTLTPAMQARIDAGERDPQAVFSKSAMRRFVQPAEVGEAIHFLASSAASAITGIVMPVDCGWLAQSAYAASAAQPA